MAKRRNLVQMLIPDSTSARILVKLQDYELNSLVFSFRQGYAEGFIESGHDKLNIPVGTISKQAYLEGYNLGKEDFNKNKRLKLDKQAQKEFDKGKIDGFNYRFGSKEKGLAYMLGYNLEKAERKSRKVSESDCFNE